MGPEGKDGKEAVEERQGGEGERPAPGSSLSRYTCNISELMSETTGTGKPCETSQTSENSASGQRAKTNTEYNEDEKSVG